MGRILVLIGCIVAVVLVVDSLRNDPDVHPLFERAQHSIGSTVGSFLAGPGEAATGNPTDCADVDDAWFQLDLNLAPAGNEVGDLIVDSTDGLVSTLVITRIDSDGGATKVDLQTSLAIGGVFATGDKRTRFREIEPPAINAKRLTAPDGSAIATVSLCYRDPNGAIPTPRPTHTSTPTASATIPASIASTQMPTDTVIPSDTVTAPTRSIAPTVTPLDTAAIASTATALPTRTPKPTRTATTPPTATPRATKTAIPVPSATATPEPSATEPATATETQVPTNTATAVPTDTATATKTLVPTDTATAVPTDTATATDTLVPTETATAVPTETATATETLVPTGTATAVPTDTATATDTLVPTETATAVPTDTATATDTLVPTETATTPPTETATATDTLAPTNTATPDPTDTGTPTETLVPDSTATPEPTATTIPLAAADPEAIAEWTVPAGWSSSAGLVTDGSNDPAAWVLPPIAVTSTNDYAVSFTFTITGGDACPRSIGVALRGSTSAYLAGGLRWNCDPEAILWAGQDQLATAPVTLTDGEHILTVAAQGTNLSLTLDGTLLVTATTDRAPTGETVGFWSDGVGIQITNVTVTDLTVPTPEATPDV